MVHWPRCHEMHSSALDFCQEDHCWFYKLSVVVSRLLLLQLLNSKLFYVVSFYVAQQACIYIIGHAGIISFFVIEHPSSFKALEKRRVTPCQAFVKPVLALAVSHGIKPSTNIPVCQSFKYSRGLSLASSRLQFSDNEQLRHLFS